MLSVSGLISTNTGTPPRSTNALAVETNVNDGMTTSSPGSMPASSAAISRAAVHEWVSSARPHPTVCSSHSSQRFENWPSLDRWLQLIASRM